MKLLLTTFFLFLPFGMNSQETKIDQGSSFVLTPEIMIGKIVEANYNFPERELLHQVLLNFKIQIKCLYL